MSSVSCCTICNSISLFPSRPIPHHPTSSHLSHHSYIFISLGFSKDGSMVFEPGYVNAKVGDTVTFKAVNKGHWVQSKALPDGVADFLSEDGKDFTLKLDKEGVYVYTCPPHRMMNMSGVIQVGKPVNKAKAQAVVDELESRAMQSKGRLKKYMQQVK